MANIVLDCVGMKCPEPILKASVKVTELQKGDTLEIVGDCHTFERDIKAWCQKTKRTLLWSRDEGAGKIRVQISV
ncbi:MAG: sulfurtransferase TusA family protein [Candidatus Xenobiia bacterium LiM19]